MDDINDKVYGVKEMMESLTVAQEDPEVDDLMAELDDVIAQEAAKSKEALPNAPASETVVQPPLPSVPTAVKKETSKNLEEDLEAMLQDLFCVC